MLTLLLTIVSVLFVASTVLSYPLTSVSNISFPDAATNKTLERFAPLFAGLPSNDISTGRLFPSCFIDSGFPGIRDLKQINRNDCYQLYHLILISDTAALPYRWDWKKSPRPRLYSYKTCSISVYAAIPSAVDTFTELGVLRVAALVVQACVTAPKGWLGGRLPVGPTQTFWVAVEGPAPHRQTLQTA
ncbi:MAG: hypothetical protein L6R36_007791 [Xanthoria steineri]|nr:MAG: hypothetical protein L6R36_007791 [Xanthoria steineri]